MIYPMNGKAETVSTTMMVCLTLRAIMKYQIEQLNKIRVAAMAINIDKAAGKNRKV